MNVNLNSNLYILFGRRTEDSNPGSLRIHSEFPKISARRYNPITDSDRGEASTFPKVPLIKAHGILMLIAWPLLGVSGIFFAAWMRPALPKGQWFQVGVYKVISTSLSFYLLYPAPRAHLFMIVSLSLIPKPIKSLKFSWGKYFCVMAKFRSETNFHR